MNLNYDQMVQRVIDFITQQGCCAATRQVYLRCFDRLGRYLSDQNSDYSPETASAWISSININKTDLALFTAAVNKANDLCRFGEIHSHHYSTEKTMIGKLCPDFRHVLDELELSISDKASDTISAHLWQCASILLFLQGKGIYSITEIQYDDLIEVYSSSLEATYYMRCTQHANLRLLLQFLYDRRLVPFGFTLFVDAMTIRYGYFWNSVPTDKLEELRSVQFTHSLPLEKYLDIRESLYCEYSKTRYSNTTLRGFLRITNLFYLFMDMNKLRYCPCTGDAWLESVKSVLPEIEYKHFRRVITLIEKQFENVEFPLSSYLVFRDTMYNNLPDWCLAEVDAFLEMKKREGWAASTIQMFQSSICRFCLGIHALGIRSFKSLDPFTVKQYNLNDKHRTAEGKNAYNSRIRKFLQYLGEKQATENPFLFLSLPCTCAARETLVITLTEEEQKTLRKIFQENDTTISLREKAMIQLGLYMGIRGIDIVNLTIDNIDWERACIRVLQEKTDYEIILPMPVPVANALYRYIMKERPESDDRSIFIRKYAPFNRISRGACLTALNHALPERKVAGSGFHVTRKTYATNLLKNNVSAQNVAEALGHRGLDNIHKYLSLEESRMRMCGLRLSDKGLLWEGGFRHE